MPSGHETVATYLGDLHSVVRHVYEALAKQVDDKSLLRVDGAQEAIRTAEAVLKRHLNSLELRESELGGSGVLGALKEALTALSGSIAGVYSTTRRETASRILRDDYTALSFLLTCTSMLHTTALAVGDGETTELTHRNLSELPPLIMVISELLPRAVVADLVTDGVAIEDGQAAETAIANLKASWKDAADQKVL